MSSKNSILLVERMLIEDRFDENLVLRVVKIDQASQNVWLFNIKDDIAWPFPMPIYRLQEELDNEEGRFIVQLDDPWARPCANSEENISLSIKRHHKRWNLIESLVTGGNELRILFKSARRELILNLSNNFNSTRQTITALLKRYWQRGMTFTALRPDYEKCGKRRDGKPKELKDKKVGAPRTITPGIGINVTNEIRRVMQVGADYYLAHKKATLQKAIDKIVYLYFSEHIKNENKKIVEIKGETDAKPTVRQLQYFLEKNYPYRYKKIRRGGQKNWDLNEREILGAADSDVQGPGDRFQVDATVADVYLRSQFDRRRIVGRPIIYFVIDVFSRLIVGIYVGFEGPSWIGAMMALTNMVTPKIEFCRQYGIDISESDWPSHHAPKGILADRGELMSVKLGHNITTSLHIDIENTSPGRPDLKSFVERRFGIVPAIFRLFTPGYVEKDFEERGTHDYRLDAVFNLYEFTHQLILAVLVHNMEPIRDYRLPAEMITDGLTASPLDLWEWGVVNRSGLLRVLTMDEVSLQVMPSEKARVTSQGIKFHKGYYSSPTAIREDWFAIARHKEWEVDVSFDPRRMELVYITDKNNPHFFEKCRLLDRSGDYEGKSLYEIDELDFAKKRVEAAGENKRQNNRILYDIQMENQEKESKSATRAVEDKDIPKSKQTADIRKNRAEEKEFQRKSESIELGEPTVRVDESPQSPENKLPADPSAYNFLEILKNKSKKRSGGYDEN